jgi:SAM-dependent methyltransferase
MSDDRPEPLERTLERLDRERGDADRRYNDALTALDRNVTRPPELPQGPPAYDEHQLSSLNQSWDVAAPPQGGWKRRLTSIVWRVIAPSLRKQTTFNSQLVDHLNRNAAAHREAARAVASTLALVRDQASAVAAFQTHLIQYLQQITAYVDTRDRRTAADALIVNAAVNGAVDDAAKRWESMRAREARLDAKVTALSAAHDELRTLVSVSQQASLTMKRELERILEQVTHTDDDGARDVARNFSSAAADADANAAFTPALDAYKYVGFEDQFRGSEDVIRQRLESYLPYFEGASDVLDVGCGRGEFLDLLKSRGISARGLDLNHEMVELCRTRGLDVSEGDVVSYLESLPDGSLGGLFAAQVVEHLQPAYLLRLLELAHHKLGSGAPLVLETLNPACWVAFFDSFIRDITHVWPLHPDTLRYLVLASGFTTARVEYRSPVAPQDRLTAVESSEPGVAELVEAFNANVEKLNARMFTYLDYAIVARRP